MFQTIQILILFFAAIFFSSCEKVIDVPLKEADRKYVIEGIITDGADRTSVRISQTKSFSASNAFEGISGASVRIEEEGGPIVTLTQQAAGIYETDLKGTPGKKYTLLVTINGETFRAESRMPQPVAIQQLYFSEMNMGSENSKQVNVVYNDPVETRNHYRFVQSVNGIKEKQIYTRNDDLSNGRLNTATLFTHDRELKKGDEVKVELQSIDAAVYTYWYSLDRGADGGSSASPANPATNWSGGALGYFSAHTVREMVIMVP